MNSFLKSNNISGRLRGSYWRLRQNIKHEKNGFTLIEVLIVLSIIAILATIVMVSLNPTKQFKFARDSQRSSHLMSILNGIGQNMIDHSGLLYCSNTVTDIPTIRTDLASAGFNIANCLIPMYLQTLPFDPSKVGAYYSSSSDFDLKYSIEQDQYGHISLYADSEGATSTIKVTR